MSPCGERWLLAYTNRSAGVQHAVRNPSYRLHPNDDNDELITN